MVQEHTWGVRSETAVLIVVLNAVYLPECIQVFALAMLSTRNTAIIWKDLGPPPRPKAGKISLKEPSRVLPDRVDCHQLGAPVVPEGA